MEVQEKKSRYQNYYDFVFDVADDWKVQQGVDV